MKFYTPRESNPGNVLLTRRNPPKYFYQCYKKADVAGNESERLSGQSKETDLVIYLAFLAKVANLYSILLTAFKKYWPDIVAKFISGTQETFI